MEGKRSSHSFKIASQVSRLAFSLVYHWTSTISTLEMKDTCQVTWNPCCLKHVFFTGLNAASNTWNERREALHYRIWLTLNSAGQKSTFSKALMLKRKISQACSWVYKSCLILNVYWAKQNIQKLLQQLSTQILTSFWKTHIL